MRAALLIIGVGLGLAACAPDEEWMVRPPGGGTGTGSEGDHDAGADGGADTGGRLCVIDDLRLPDACPGTADAGGVAIEVEGGAATTTDAGGRFVLAPSTTARVLDVADSSPRLVPATARLLAGEAAAVRAMHAAAFDDVLAAVGAPALGGQGGVVVYVDDAGGAPLAGVTFAVSGQTSPTFYDDGAATRWRADAGTGVAGVALLLGVPEGRASVVGAVAGGGQLAIDDVPVRAGALTFVRAAAP